MNLIPILLKMINYNTFCDKPKAISVLFPIFSDMPYIILKKGSTFVVDKSQDVKLKIFFNLINTHKNSINGRD